MVKKSLKHFKKKTKLFEELANEGMGKIQNLSKQIDFNNLIYYFKDESGTKSFISFKGPLAFSKNTKDGYITLEKGEEKQKIKMN